MQKINIVIKVLNSTFNAIITNIGTLLLASLQKKDFIEITAKNDLSPTFLKICNCTAKTSVLQENDASSRGTRIPNFPYNLLPSIINRAEHRSHRHYYVIMMTPLCYNDDPTSIFPKNEAGSLYARSIVKSLFC